MPRNVQNLVLRGGLASLLLVVGGALIPAQEAHAQQRVVARSFAGGGGGGGNQISSRSLEKYAKILGLNEEQKESAKQLHEGYQASYRSASQAMQKEMEEAREAFEETQDGSVFAERIPVARKAFKEQSTKAETEFFADLKQLLNEKQLAGWDRLERARRRETLLKGGSLSGEAVDLVEIVNGLNLGADSKDVAEAMDQYEADLDRALLAKKAMQDKQGELEFGPGKFDLAEIQKRSAEAKEAGGKIKQINQDHARKIEPLLPEPVRPAFDTAVKRQSFPRVYKPSQVAKSLDAAMKLDDLDAGQKETLRSLKDSYEREAAPLNDAWASAIEQDEQDPNNMSLGGDSMSIKISSGPDGDEETPLSKARKARREFDSKIKERLSATLTPAQREKLPKAAPPGTPGEETEDEDVVVAPASGVFISR